MLGLIKKDQVHEKMVPYKNVGEARVCLCLIFAFFCINN